MSDTNGKPHDQGTTETPFAKFDAFTRKLMAVPKSEIDAAEKKYQQRKQREKKRTK